jgi:hypothetical protein
LRSVEKGLSIREDIPSIEPFVVLYLRPYVDHNTMAVRTYQRMVLSKYHFDYVSFVVDFDFRLDVASSNSGG